MICVFVINFHFVFYLLTHVETSRNHFSTFTSIFGKIGEGVSHYIYISCYCVKRLDTEEASPTLPETAGLIGMPVGFSKSRPMAAATADTAKIICCACGRRFTMEPTPTPLAPAAMARGAVTSVRPDAHITGIFTAREMANADARVGAAVSMSSCTSDLSVVRTHRNMC